MAQGVKDSILIDGGGDVSSLLFQFVDGIAHRHTNACLEDHRGVIATITKGYGSTGIKAFMTRHSEDALALIGTIGSDISKLRMPAA